MATSSSGLMPIVVVGHVDHGKSTVIGRLLADTGSLPQGKLEQVRAACERDGRPFEYAFLIDALRDERAQNITIDSARVFFKSSLRNYIIIDAPGHVEFVKNMVTGAARAEAALLVIDAQEGICENTRRHGYLLWLLGISRVIVLINKIDLVDYSQSVFETIRHDYNQFLAGVGLTPQMYLPVSGRQGDNIAVPSRHMPWFTGPTVLEALDNFEPEPQTADRPLRLPVQDVYRFTALGDARRIVAGQITSGSLRLNDDVMFYPSGKRSTVKSIEVFNATVPQAVMAGHVFGFTLAEQIYIQRGEIAVRVGEPAPRVSTRFRASLLWLGREPLRLHQEFWLKLGAARVKGQLSTITRLMDVGRDLASSDHLTAQINRHEVAECEITLQHALAFDLASDFTDTGRFVIVVDYEIGGGGIVLESLPDQQGRQREAVFLRNLKWEKSGLTAEARAERYSQRAILVLITGPQGVGRKTIARELETMLFTSGRVVYYLAIGSILYGVDADLPEHRQLEARSEHMRRLAEVAYILLDAGVILVVTAIEITQTDLEVIKAGVGADRLETVWVGDKVTTDLRVDLQLPGGGEVNASALQIKSRLQARGVIFSP